ncbi:MAG: DEAD/DEAH box helicase, partial [Halobacteria archaeon]
ENDIIVATSEKVDSLIRNNVSWIKDLTTVVADEIHLLDDGERGPTLEVTLSKIRELNPRVQVIGLSATVSNADVVADWLDAYLLESSWRPVDLRRGVYNNKKQEIEFENHENKDIEKDLVTDPTVSLVDDSVGAEGQVLVFVAHRKDTMELAKNLKQLSLGGCEEIADTVMENAEAEVGEILASCIRDGVAFHHAGLDRGQKKLVEKGFREREIKAIAATPSLAAGVNVPARRVVVRDVSRYEGDGYVDIPVLQVQQMFGRAGRPGLDPYGEAVLVSGRKNSVDELRDRYIDGEPERVLSKLASEEMLRKHVLATVSNRFAGTYEELLDFISNTFYAHQESEETIESQLKEVVGSLVSFDMLSLELGEPVVIESTGLGDLVSKLYLDPVTADRFIETVEAVEGNEITATSRTWLQTVGESPDIYNFWLGYSDDEERYLRYAVEELEGEVIDTLDSSVENHLDVYKTMRVLSDWISGTDVEELTEKYDLFPGDIRNRTERARWILYGAKAIAGFVTTDQDIIDSISETHDRVVYGVDGELLDLVEVDEVGRVRARSLYRRGIRDKQDLLDSPKSRLETILGARTAEKVLESLE